MKEDGTEGEGKGAKKRADEKVSLGLWPANSLHRLAAMEGEGAMSKANTLPLSATSIFDV